MILILRHVKLSTMNKAINNWLKSSHYDLQTAEAMLKTKRHLYVIFMCHLAVEKALKAIVAKKTKNMPPKTHDLFSLVRLAAVTIPEEHVSTLAHLNEVSVPTRYPEDIDVLIKSYTQSVAQRYLKQSKGLLSWLHKQAT